MLDFLRKRWKGSLVLLFCLGALQVALDWAISALIGLILALLIGLPLFDHVMDKILIRRVKQHIEKLGYAVVEIKRWREHFGVTYMADQEKRYVRFAHSTSFGKLVQWIDEPPS
jgi:hypothetical protein